MTKTICYDWNQIEGACQEIIRQLCNTSWRPDYIVGLTRGGVIPATLLSHYLSIPMKALTVNLRDHIECVSDTGMAEDAFGYSSEYSKTVIEKDLFSNNNRKNILIVDDINDTGATIQWIKKDWQKSCFPDSDVWPTVWHNNVRFAMLVNNASSQVGVDYYCWDINKSYEDCWVVFPWENFWCKNL